MQQQPQHMLPVMPSFPSSNITTTEIQKYLDENKKLILAILDNQNLGKLAECAQFQAQLQKNLMFLAAIADAQPQTPAIPPQMAPNPVMHQGGYYMPHPQAAAMAQQGIFPSKIPTQYTPHQMQEQHQQQLQQQRHQQAIQGQMSLRPFGADTTGSGGISSGNRQDGSEAGGADGQGGSAANHGGAGNGEPSDAK